MPVFPSGHAVSLAFVASRFTHAPAQKAYVFIIPRALVGTICLSRIYLGVHYPTDVHFGWCAGSLWCSPAGSPSGDFFRHRCD
ncbi:phosphatase PAP2 family protein [Rhizobium mesoamericanum]|uniref:phosphatase PAP2 family protein n=1 Tax=Rhizobium mesoamericanum TaxID=1079800 RepID=UPI003520020B